MHLATDRRRIEASLDPEGERLAAECAAEYLTARLRLARLLLRIERRGTFRLAGCSSVVQYGVRLGVPAAEARSLVRLARSLEVAEAQVRARTGASEQDAVRAVDARVRAGRLSVEAAAVVGKIFERPECLRKGEDWLDRAETVPLAQLRHQVDRRIEETAQREAPLSSLTLHVTDLARDEFRRAQVLASKHAGGVLTQGQTFTLLVRRYLAAADPLRRGARPRRARPTAETPRERYIPAEVRRAVLERSGDRCEVPDCSFDTYLAFAHIEAHAEGGDREAGNLLRLCHAHHTQLDAGCLRFAGWRDGRPCFRSARGWEVSPEAAPTSGPEESAAPPADSEEPSAGQGAGCARRERSYDLAGSEEAARAVRSQVSERPPPTWARAG